MMSAGTMEFGQIMSVRNAVFSCQTQVALHGVRRTHAGLLKVTLGLPSTAKPSTQNSVTLS
jgi:hypothetical protein